MVNFMEYGNNTRYKTVVENSCRSLYSLLEAYGPYPSFDDMGWYGLSYARIYEVLGNKDFLQNAIDIFNWSWKTGSLLSFVFHFDIFCLHAFSFTLSSFTCLN